MPIKTTIDRRGIVETFVPEGTATTTTIETLSVGTSQTTTETIVDLTATGNVSLGDNAAVDVINVKAVTHVTGALDSASSITAPTVAATTGSIGRLDATGNVTLGNGGSDTLIINAATYVTGAIDVNSSVTTPRVVATTGSFERLTATGNVALGDSIGTLIINTTQTQVTGNMDLASSLSVSAPGSLITAASVEATYVQGVELMSTQYTKLTGTLNFDAPQSALVQINTAVNDPVLTSVDVSGKTIVLLSGSSGSVAGFNLTGASRGQFVLLINSGSIPVGMKGFVDGGTKLISAAHVGLVVYCADTSSWWHLSGSM